MRSSMLNNMVWWVVLFMRGVPHQVRGHAKRAWANQEASVQQSGDWAGGSRALNLRKRLLLVFGHVMNPTKRIRFRVRIHVTSSRTQESLHRKYQVQVRPNSPPTKPSPRKISPMITTSGMALSASCDATERTSRRILLAINDRSGTRSVIALVRLLNSSAELDVIFDHARLLSSWWGWCNCMYVYPRDDVVFN